MLVVKKVNIHDAKTNLSRYLEAVENGETVIICNRNVPVAELRPIARVQRRRRSVGLAKGDLLVPASFFDPLPDALTDAFCDPL